MLLIVANLFDMVICKAELQQDSSLFPNNVLQFPFSRLQLFLDSVQNKRFGCLALQEVDEILHFTGSLKENKQHTFKMINLEYGHCS